MDHGDIKLKICLKNLPPPKHKSAFPSTYVLLKLRGKQVNKTEVQRNSADPKFQTVVLTYENLEHCHTPLLLEVWQREPSILKSDVFVGQVSIELDYLRFRAITSGKTIFGVNSDSEAVFTLESKDGKKVWGALSESAEEKKVHTSELHLKFQATNLASILGHCSVATFHHINFDDLMLNFTMYKGVFNINGFTQALAEGECRSYIQKKLGPRKWPNTIQIRILRARNLRQTSDNPPNARFRVKIRSEERNFRLHVNNRSPLVNEAFSIPCKDPSAVLSVTVSDEKSIGKGSIIGQWRMTLKYIYMNPKYNFHNSIEVDDNHTIKGWFPLVDKSFDNSHCGEVEMWIRWAHTAENESYEPQELTALQQMQENSAEGQLKQGNLHNMIQMLSRFPILFDIRRVTIRNLKFYLKDLFLGREGEAERVKGNLESIDLPIIDVIEAFKPTSGARGIHLFKVLTSLALGIMPHIKGSTIGSAASQILGGISSSFTSLFAKYNVECSEHLAATEGWANFRKKMKVAWGLTCFHDVVTSFDHDFWKRELMVGELEISKNNSMWDVYFATLRGNTLFYWEIDEKKSQAGVVHKCDLSMVEQIKPVKQKTGRNEIHILCGSINTRLRVPINRGSPLKAEDWFNKLVMLQKRLIPFAIKIQVISGNNLIPCDLSGKSDPYVTVCLQNRAQNSITYEKKSVAINSSLNPVWCFEEYLWPIPLGADGKPELTQTFLNLRVHDKDVGQADDFMGTATLPLKTLLASVMIDPNLNSRGGARGTWDNISERVLSLKDPDRQIHKRGKSAKNLGTLKVKVDLISHIIQHKNSIKLGSQNIMTDTDRKFYLPQMEQDVNKLAAELFDTSPESCREVDTEEKRLPISTFSQSLPLKFDASPSAKKVNARSDNIEKLILCSKIMHLLDEDGSRDLSMEEAQPLLHHMKSYPKLQESLMAFIKKNSGDDKSLDWKNIFEIFFKKKLNLNQATGILQYLEKEKKLKTCETSELREFESKVLSKETEDVDVGGDVKKAREAS